jgi:hypothetical protein
MNTLWLLHLWSSQMWAVAPAAPDLGFIRQVLYWIAVLVVIGGVCWFVWWIFNKIPIPEPARTVIMILLMICLFIVVLYYVIMPLLGFIKGGAFLGPLHPPHTLFAFGMPTHPLTATGPFHP